MLQLSKLPRMRTLASTEDAYELCRQITAKYAKTFYPSTLLMSKPKRRAIWAIYAWCRLTDELVDGSEAGITTPETLDRWEQQLESVFAGEPVDDPDVALVDALQRFSIDIEPFRDMIAGQRMDLYRSRYKTFEELHLYCYRVAGTVGLMSTSVMGVDTKQYVTPWNQDAYVPTQQAIALGIASQLTNILRDVGEDSRRGRIYLPLDELALFNYTEQDLINGVVDERWRELMRFQIQRARKFYREAEKGISYLSPEVRWPVWAALMLYSQILDAIEKNDYDVFTKRAYVPTPRKLLSLPVAWLRAQAL
ncbi:phytoene synthase [Funiculus sociatus GB2-A5]|jgi:phytoene synthase|uniref:Phytoene synthase n=1 Tax=Funiculus sociatus GB2-A5 TaxID=2933946 RepID=A0ABV0JLL8_9CYAN|nr:MULTISPECIES: phytoene synthase [unclassified Trichocoleus]MBD1903968.1 phytoene synthase [Trichocoleus sp. FACHB-832]MBD2062739.1 phytoene synthase [Trichocoleus sp. FACHB-6]